MISFLCLIGTAAHASSDVYVYSDLGYSCAADTRRYHGGGFGLGGRISLSETIQLGTRYQLSEHRGKGQAFTVHNAAVGGVLLLDVFHYVPWAAVYLGPSWSDAHPTLNSPDFGYSFDLGVDRLLDREWSVGAFLQFHSLASIEKTPAVMFGGIRVEYRFSLDDPFDD